MLNQIICSGQSGSERAALDAAIQYDFIHGGFCMPNRLAEDGHIDQHYQLLCNEQSCLTTTEANAEFSDASVIFYLASLQPTQEMTLLHCIEMQHPYKLLDMEVLTPSQAAGCLLGFVQAHDIGVLNVSGPPASTTPGSYEYSFEVISQLLRSYLPLSDSGHTSYTRLWNQR